VYKAYAIATTTSSVKRLNAATFLCLSQACIYVIVYLCSVFSALRWGAIDGFVDIGGIVYHHCLNFLFKVRGDCSFCWYWWDVWRLRGSYSCGGINWPPSLSNFYFQMSVTKTLANYQNLRFRRNVLYVLQNINSRNLTDKPSHRITYLNVSSIYNYHQYLCRQITK